MQKPENDHRIICPESNEKLIPEKIWKSQLPNGERVTYGIFKLHHHNREVCEHSHMVARVITAVEAQPVFAFMTNQQASPNIYSNKPVEYVDITGILDSSYWEQQWEEIAELLVGCD